MKKSARFGPRMAFPSIGDGPLSSSSSSSSLSDPLNSNQWSEMYEVEIGPPENAHDTGSAHPVQIVKKDDKRNVFSLDETALSSILERPDVCDRKVAIVSVAGAFRTGKSFLLNFFLRYLQFKGDKENWLRNESATLVGFKWRGGAERETSGIWLWNEPFIVTTDDGEKVAVLLMDTQGSFDCQSTIKECAGIFAMSTLISSVQIYNLMQNLQEDHLQNLQLFTEYGRFALEEMDCEPFQTLLFLIRDWYHACQFPYGFEGGWKLLKRRLKEHPDQHAELQHVRQNIRSSFSEVCCFLMPHPGTGIISKKRDDFKGQLSKIDSDFKEYLDLLVPSIFSPENLVPKRINGKEITGKELLHYFSSYINVFQYGEIPEPETLFLATAKANHLSAFDKAKGEYLRNMRELLEQEKPSLSDEKLLYFHQVHRGYAVKMFRQIKKMGGDVYTRRFLEKLTAEIEDAFKLEFTTVNERKRRSESIFFRAGCATIDAAMKTGAFLYEHREAIFTGASVVVGAVLIILGKR